MKAQPANERPTAASWLKRLGLGGFLFFFAKGLLWLALPYLASLAVF